MRFSASYRQYTHYKDLNEIKFPISLLSNAVNTALQYPDKRIVVHIVELEGTIAIEKLLEILTDTPNLYLELYDIEDVLTLTSALKVSGDSKKIFYHHPATTFNMIYFLMKNNVSDIVLGEPIVFDLSEVRKMVPKSSGVILRVNPVQGRPPLYESIKDEDDGLYHFWAVPQSVRLYDEYIDVFDLNDPNEQREDVLITIFSREEYNHSLNSLCKNIDNQIPCSVFSDEDLRYRLTCRQRCIRGTCHRCRVISDMYLRIKDLQNGK